MCSTNKVVNILNDHTTQDLLNAYGLRAHSITWEDTARTKGSCWGPNISDMTLTIRDGNKLMPVIRKPNFSDVTDDVPIENFRLMVGNETGSSRKILSLEEYLKNISKYLPDNDKRLNLYDSRDSVVLTSSQCCVIPVDKSTTEFAVQLFNYQSSNNSPAVLVILVTKDGTSTQIIQSSNQKLFFNDNGKARWFTAERLQDYRERNTGQTQEKVNSYKEMKSNEKLENTIMMIQVPLKVANQTRTSGLYDMGLSYESKGLSMFNCENSARRECKSYFCSVRQKCKREEGRGMDMGMVGLGTINGDFIGTKGLKLERDTRFPIRCTFQYYRVTDKESISEHDIQDIASQLSQATNKAVASGSLVSNPDTGRTTEPNLNEPKSTDSPFGKLDQTATVTWGTQSMATFV